MMHDLELEEDMDEVEIMKKLLEKKLKNNRIIGSKEDFILQIKHKG